MSTYLSIDVEPDYPPHINTNKGVLGMKKIYELIKKSGSCATAFVCAGFLDENPEILEYLDGFEIGCHGLKHDDITTIASSKFEKQIKKALKIFTGFGIEARGFRAPYARASEENLKVIAKYFEYDSSIDFYKFGALGKVNKINKKYNLNLIEFPLFLGGKSFGVSPKLFNLSLHFPVKNKIYFIHPWEFGGVEFEEIAKRRRNLKYFNYKSENYFKNLESVLKTKPQRIEGLLRN